VRSYVPQIQPLDQDPSFVLYEKELKPSAKAFWDVHTRTRWKPTRTRIVPGMIVTTREPAEVYYAGYGGHRYLEFMPGDLGIVHAVVPKVCNTSGTPTDYFAVVDFFIQGDWERVDLNCIQIDFIR
jgi:hypothetical protein